MVKSLHNSRSFSGLCLVAIAAGGVLFAFAITPRAHTDVNDIADIFLIKAQTNRPDGLAAASREVEAR